MKSKMKLGARMQRGVNESLVERVEHSGAQSWWVQFTAVPWVTEKFFKQRKCGVQSTCERGMDMEIDEPQKTDDEARPLTDDELFRAAEAGKMGVLRQLSGEEITRASSLRNEDCRSLLHVAASAAQTEVVDYLSSLEQFSGCINSKDEEGWAPLHSAASSGRVDILEILLNRGGDINLTNNGGCTALHYAASKGWLKMAEVLISHGAKINKKDKVGCTPLHRAASTGNIELCEFLIEEGAEVDALDRSGQTPLMHAVICENKQVALLLIRHGADVDVEDKEGYTVLGRASEDFRPSLIDAAKAMLEG